MSLALLFLITLVAAIMQAMTGFGFALLVVPFLVLMLEMQTALQTATVVTLVTSVMMLPHLYHHLVPGLLRHVLFGSMLGFPIGYVLLKNATPPGIQIAVGGVILFALSVPYLVKRPKTVHAGKQVKSIVTGLISGAMTTALAMPGPPIAFYMRHLGIKKDPTRAMIFSVFVVSYTCALVLQWTMQGIAGETWHMVLYLLPFAVVGTLLGRRLSGMINDVLFKNLITLILFVTACYLLLTNLV